MKTNLKTLALALSLAVSVGAVHAAPPQQPAKKQANKTAFEASMYRATDGRIVVNVEKDLGNGVSVSVEDEKGKTMYNSYIDRQQGLYTVKLDLKELTDGNYTVKVSNGANTTQQAIQLATQPTPQRLITMNK